MSEINFPARFALGALATWRVAHLVAEEDGPGDVVVRLRARAGAGAIGAAMDCLYCLSIWVAAPIALLIAPRARDRALTWLALSGAACLLEQATGPRTPHDPLGAHDTTTETRNGLLWPQAARA